MSQKSNKNPVQLKPLDDIRRGVYVSEILFLSKAIMRNAERLFSEMNSEALIQMDNELPYLASSISIDAARIGKIINNKRPMDSRYETKSQFEFRVRRVEMFQATIKELGITEMLGSSVRNSLEHFDEHADKFLQDKQPDDKREIRYVLSQNICVWTVEDYQKYLDEAKLDKKNHISWIRCYVGSEKALYTLQGKINIQKIYDEAVALNKNLMFPGYKPEDRAQGISIALL
ncbi:hypothetical protein GGE65_008360 [Skermanella aerolata]|uniref:hypothetical protein n=1 Tax=Skermanella aerolata TaxID=393310 RepID=UPI003D1E047D